MVSFEGFKIFVPCGTKETVISELLVKWLDVGSVLVCGVVEAKFVQYVTATVPAFPAFGVPAGHLSPLLKLTAGVAPFAGIFSDPVEMLKPG